ncbi:MAG TPA: hypothetical protein VN380_08530 [Thermoanaerobaculia bacterium]|nr:hypothetical protein [Thermoanaerobaculia bacterium]
MNLWRLILGALCFLFVAVSGSAQTYPSIYTACSLDRDGTIGVYAGVTHEDFDNRPDIPQGSTIYIGGANIVRGYHHFDYDYGGYVRYTSPDVFSDFEFDLTGEGCDTAAINACDDFMCTYADAGSALCWNPPGCYLLVTVNSGGSPSTGDPTGYYSCTACISLTAIALDGWEFDSWSGAVNSTDPVVSVCMNNSDRYETAYFRTAPPGPDTPPDIQDGCNPQCSPIVINFAESPYVLTGANAPVLFDMSGDGHPTLMGWTAAGADEAFLWLDRNHNHRVTGGGELFGNFTPLQNGHLAKNGFEALAEFDANHDGVIDERDPVWPQLMLWRDLNHNGISEPNEISPLDASDVTAIDLHYHWTGRHDSLGNAFRYESLISIKIPSGRAARKQPVYDIFFVSVSQ